MFSTLRGGLEWAQSLSAPPKIIITVLVLLLAGLALVLLWQRAPEIPSTVGKAPSTTTKNSNTVGNAHDVQATVAGNGNAVSAPKLDQHISGEHASVQTGTASSSGQSGGVTAGNYYAAPSTPQEKEQQIERLKAELSDLAEFPNKGDVGQPNTMLEGLSRTKVPIRLYSTLDRYVKQTIVGVPGVGERLFDFRKSYYEFSQSQQDLETIAITSVGPHVEGKLRAAWTIYFRYFLLRSSGHSADDVKEAGNFLNYDITWEDAERVYQELSKTPAVGPPIRANVSRLVKLQAEAAQLVTAIKAQGF